MANADEKTRKHHEADPSHSTGAARDSFRPGSVNFLNNAATPIRTNSLGNGGNISGANAYRIGLYTAPPGTVNESLFALLAVATNSSLVVGRIGSGGGLVTIPGNTGTPIAYQVKAWSLSAGATYEAAVASGTPFATGKSPIGQVTPGVAGGPAPTLFSSTAGVPEFPGQLSAGFDLFVAIPEPSTYALAAIGILTLACCRKRLSAKLR